MRIYIHSHILPYKKSYLEKICRPLIKKARIKDERIEILFLPGHYRDWQNARGEYRFQLGFIHFDYDPITVECYVDAEVVYPFEFMNKYTMSTTGMITVSSQEDLMRFVLAHEFCHVTSGHPDNFKLPMGGIDTHAMELCCDSFAFAATGIRN